MAIAGRSARGAIHIQSPSPIHSIKSKTNRLLFLEAAGLFHKKVLLRSEYGVIVGEAQWNATKDPYCFVNGQKIYFSLSVGQLQFFDKEKNLLFTINIEPLSEADRMEKFAIVFTSAWLLAADLTNRETEDRLVA